LSAHHRDTPEGCLLGSDGDSLVALIRQLPESVRERVIETMRTRLLPLVDPTTN